MSAEQVVPRAAASQIASYVLRSAQSWSIEVYQDLATVYAVWDSLYATTPNPGPFVTWEYVSTWWQHFGSAYTPYILVATHDSSPDKRVLLPLMRQGNQLRWIATPGPDSVCVLHNAADTLEDGLSAIAGHLRKQRWAKLSLTYLRDSEAAVFKRAFKGIQYRADYSMACPFIEIQQRSWQDYLATLSHSRRQDIKALSRKLKREEKTIRFETTRDPKRIEALWETICQITAVSHTPEKLDLFVGHEGAFLMAICRDFAAHGWLEVMMAYLDDVPIAYTIYFTLNGVSGYWRAAYDESYYDYSPGKWVLLQLMQSSFERGDCFFDFMQGTQHYKLQWTDQVQPLVYLVFYHNPLVGHAVNLKTALSKHFVEQNWLYKLQTRVGNYLKKQPVS